MEPTQNYSTNANPMVMVTGRGWQLEKNRAPTSEEQSYYFSPAFLCNSVESEAVSISTASAFHRSTRFVNNGNSCWRANYTITILSKQKRRRQSCDSCSTLTCRTEPPPPPFAPLNSCGYTSASLCAASLVCAQWENSIRALPERSSDLPKRRLGKQALLQSRSIPPPLISLQQSEKERGTEKTRQHLWIHIRRFSCSELYHYFSSSAAYIWVFFLGC